MKILSSQAIREIDAKTIEYDGISSHELMEKAATAFFDYFKQKYTDKEKTVALFCGMGNNGGDGLAVARLLHKAGYSVEVFVVKINDKYSDDCALNLEKARKMGVPISTVHTNHDIPEISKFDIIIDAIFGTGLSRELSRLAKDVIDSINKSKRIVLSIDVPSGLFLDKFTSFAVEATETITFQIPKLALFLPENTKFVGKLSMVDIGLNARAIEEAETDICLLTSQNISSKLKPLTKFAHKGTQGHALIIGGSLGKIGAVSLASKAALKSGCGLVTAYVPECGLIPLQSNFPEAMVIQDHNPTHISSISFDIKPDAIAIGMGMGKHEETQQALQQFLHYNQTPLVVDADALNILSENSYWLSMLQSNTILTPHPGELSRLIGHWENGFQKIELTRAFAQKYQVIVVVKGAHTLIIDSTHIYVNSSGTPALATAGSGDVLSGILAGLLAQGYDPMEAAQVGVYIHGMTATITSDEINPRAFIAGDIIDNIGRAYNRLDFHEE
ncbi:MAG: NAD(P)H-hydrate dehydratase [Dysgonamonadaceae bacterium]|nr:NAD(P)H-hydrate dehydratase [Dysgonamonadaceae bacterium]